MKIHLNDFVAGDIKPTVLGLSPAERELFESILDHFDDGTGVAHLVFADMGDAETAILAARIQETVPQLTEADAVEIIRITRLWERHGWEMPSSFRLKDNAAGR